MRLSNRVFEIVRETQYAAEWCSKIAARIDADCPYLPDHFTSDGRTADYFDGLRDGHHSTIESLLMAHNAYKGYWSEVCNETGARWNQYDLSRAEA
jgi:hypothetical protein